MKVSYIVPKWLAVWGDETDACCVKLSVECPSGLRATKVAGNLSLCDTKVFLNISKSGKAWRLFCVGGIPSGMKTEGEAATPREAAREAVEAFLEYAEWPGRRKTTRDETAAK